MAVSVRYLIVAGGGGGGSDHGGGGGAGGLLAGTVSKSTGTSYTITVGAGGTGGQYPTDGTNGGNSVFDTLTAIGGGRGQTQTIGTGGSDGGSGGGGNGGPGYLPGGSGTSGQGNDGGYGSGTNPSGYGRGGGGGGAGAAGDDASTTGGDGGDGVTNDITGTSTYYAGGGGGGSFNTGAGGQGGQGGGGDGGGTSNNSGANGTDGLGGGGGGASNNTGGATEFGGDGGDGVVILRFASTTPTPTVTGSPTITTVGSDKVYKWTANGSITFVSVDATINATVTDTDVDAKDATLEIGATIDADVTDVDVNGKDATINVVSNITVDQDVTDIDVTGKAATIITDSSTQIAVTKSNIDIAGKAATVTAEINSINNAIVSNIDIAGVDSQNLYPSLVLQDNPIHYWKFTLQSTEYNIKDFAGSKDGTLVSVDGDRDFVSNLDSNSFVAGINSDFGSNSIYLSSTAASSDSDSRRQRVQFASEPIVIGDNLTYEIWFKTSSSYSELFVFDSVNRESTYSFNQREKALGIIDGKLTIWGMPANTTLWRDREIISTYDNLVNDNNWHHLMMTKNTSSGITTYKSYLDGEETTTLLSLGDLLTNVNLFPTETEFFIGSHYGLRYNTNTSAISYNTFIDDVAIYETALTLQDAKDRYGAGAGSTSVVVNADSTDINIDQTSTTGNKVINVTKSNISVKLRSVQVSDGTNVTVFSPVNNIVLDGKDPTTSFVSENAIIAKVANINVESKLNKVSTAVKDFKFISSLDTSLSARDAETIDGLDFAGLLFNQEKILQFKIGNTSKKKSNFTITVESREEDITDAVQLSYNRIDYSDSLYIENIEDNYITDVIYIKFTTNFIYLIGPGSFLINVEQTNA